MNLCCLIYGAEKHYLDHLAPLASLLEIPLLVTEISIETLAKKYYPDVSVQYYPPIEMEESVVQHFEVVISCLPKVLFDSLFLIPETLHQKKLINVWCPHGNSDKGHKSYFMEELANEKWMFVYGKQMIDVLKKKNAFDQIENYFYLGNFRHQYFLNHIKFYQEIVKREIIQNLCPNARTLLYAPTWDDCEKNSSFSSSISTIIDAVPNHWNLIIKPHPNTSHTIISHKKNILILDDFPPIYPLLDFVDVYLGDMSSIGYDFLTFRKPLFFLHPDNHHPLFKCGTIIPSRNLANIFKIIDQTNATSFIKIQELMYDNLFEPNANPRKIYDACSRPCPL